LYALAANIATHPNRRKRKGRLLIAEHIFFDARRREAEAKEIFRRRQHFRPRFSPVWTLRQYKFTSGRRPPLLSRGDKVVSYPGCSGFCRIFSELIEQLLVIRGGLEALRVVMAVLSCLANMAFIVYSVSVFQLRFMEGKGGRTIYERDI
jgi:hypothetical protein